MDKTWNFHGHVAEPLEKIAKSVLGQGCSFTADSIEAGCFVRAMYAVLDKMNFKDRDHSFIGLASEYLDKPASQIPSKKAQYIFAEFQKITTR